MKNLDLAAILIRNDEALLLLKRLLLDKRIDKPEYEVIEDSLYEVPRLLHLLQEHMLSADREPIIQMIDSLLHVLQNMYPHIDKDEFLNSVCKYFKDTYA